ncbi:MAG: cysteine synthase family protein [Chitinophagaceae bacterium]
MQTKQLTPADNRLLEDVKKLSVQIGNTPVHRINHLFNKKGVEIFAKKEWLQLSGSVKARAAYNIIRSAILSGELNTHKTLLDATSGNTGIAYATIAKALKIPVTLCLPENASPKRKQILLDLGVTIIYTSKFEGTDGAQQVAQELALKYPGKYFYADQYKNENNWKAHYHTTAVEIFKEFPGITHFIAGLGTTGTFTGTGKRLRELKPSVKLISLQPDTPLHGLEGWKHMETAIVPRIYDPSVADENWEIDTLRAYEIIKAAKKHEGLLLSPSSAANLAGAIKAAEQIDEGIIITVLPDNADKYSEIINSIV